MPKVNQRKGKENEPGIWPMQHNISTVICGYHLNFLRDALFRGKKMHFFLEILII